MRIGSVEIVLERSGIISSQIGLTQFDACLCNRQEGYFVRDITMIDKSILSTIRMSSGIYTLDRGELYPPFRWAWEAASIAGDTLTLLADDPWDGEWTYTWIYREVDATGPKL